MVGQKNNQENPMPVIDEGWWSSVLAEEGRNSTHPQPRSAGNRSEVHSEAKLAQGKAETGDQSEKRTIANWDQVKDMYMRDQIVDLAVTGHNRGGLLVEGNGLYGFVPFSHLVGLSDKGENPDRDHNLEAYVGRSLSLESDRVCAGR